MAQRQPSKLVGPFRIEGQVTKGFGRGSKELGIPTANFSEEVVARLPSHLETGIYFGWTQLEHDDNVIRKAVVSIGWNPYYDNSKKSVETHIMWEYDQQFYDKWLKLLICGYIRPEKNYDSLRKFQSIGLFPICLMQELSAFVKRAPQSMAESGSQH